MQLTRHTDYALRLLIYLQTHADDEIVSVDRIARAYGISQNHLAKVAQQLVRHGWVHSTRGRGGGLSLADQAEAVTVGEIVRAMEANHSVVECLGEGSTCPIEPACGLKKAMRRATEAFLETLDDYVLSDIVRNPKKIRTLLTIAESG